MKPKSYNDLKKKIFTLILCSVSLGTWAKPLELTKGESTIFVEEKANWELGKDLFGIPFMYFSPAANGQRSNISFADTGAEAELDVKTLADNQGDFKKNKEAWAETVGAKTLSFFPYESKMNKLGHRLHKIGFEYEHEGKHYVEVTNYIECRGKVIFSKSLRLKANEAHDKDFNELVHNLDCGGV